MKTDLAVDMTYIAVYLNIHHSIMDKVRSLWIYENTGFGRTRHSLEELLAWAANMFKAHMGRIPQGDEQC